MVLGAGIAVPQQGKPANTCLAFVSHNLAHGRENFYTYLAFSDKKVKLQEGDKLVYSIFLDPKNPVAKGGMDLNFEDQGEPLRDLGLKDEQGIIAHGDGILTPAVGKWYDRKILLTGQAGRTVNSWQVLFEGDEFGRYAEWLDDVAIEHADGTRTVVYDNGVPEERQLEETNGYSKMPYCVVVDRANVVPGADTDTLVARVETLGKRTAALDKARRDIKLAKDFLAKNPDPALDGHIHEATAMLDAVEQKEATPQEIEAALHAADHALSHTHPVMEQYTGHLVGHAHIDLQWLWEWQEGIVFTHDTFNQATKFMDEFPGFTFSQSSSTLYQATEQQYPALFKKIQQKVKNGQWEIVGGRVCEGDTNMISPESSARHYLYGQRYFREKFGKTAVVGWEPDTFGHNAQMPQIAKLGGCTSYYFCRGGKEKPLFWWEALDGTRLLTFDEPATGSWYNSDLSYSQFKEMLDFQDHTTSKDMLWVYGVGNHGGGPTREMIEVALGWMKEPNKPKVKFSTATQFFDKLRTYDLKKIPVIHDELNPVFDGCYTSHSEIKQANRLAEATTSSAEAIATMAALKGFAYPKEAFRKSWEEICYNHHHDTLPGSGIHPPYEKTKVQLARVVMDDRDTIQRAMESMAVQVTAPEGISEMVFNPTGWKRSGWVETYLVHSGFDSPKEVDPQHAVAVAPDGTQFPVQVLDAQSRKVRFWAGDVPAFGYKVYSFRTGNKPSVAKAGEDTFDTDNYRIKFDRSRGVIASFFDKKQNRELVPSGDHGLGRLEAAFEGPGGMSAWVIGKISKVTSLTVTNTTLEDDGGQPVLRVDYTLPAHNSSSKDTKVTQRFHIDNQTGQIAVDVDCDWNAVGTNHEPTPLLRVAFDTNLEAPKATYEIPFGSIQRKVDNTEVVALEWGDLSDGKGGLSILNDSKHGYSADGSTIRLTLIRASYEPDPVPNPGHHHWRYAILPHTADMNAAGISKVAAEFNQPLLVASVPYDAKGDQPLQWSALSLTDPNVVPTALKMSEDGDDLIVRAYQATGAPSTGAVKSNLPVASANVVNFIEDTTGAATTDGSTVNLPLRGFEIKTLKLRLRPIK